MESNLEKKPKNYYEYCREEMFPFIPDDVRVILEVGCGEGNFSSILKQKIDKSEVWGIEISEAEAKVAAEKLDKVLVGSAESQIDQLSEDYFELVIFNDVLEHLTNPYNILQQIKSKLKPGGRIVSSIPNMRYFPNLFDLLWRKNWDYTDSGIMDKTHLRFFTVNSILKMYQGQGYKVLQHQGINATKSIKFKTFNTLSFGKFSDSKYLQYATVAQKM
jgi:2-polyprenyl-3-methyl-5-hydroxy-6-metoxy-1,4-benzoquinol methylase